MRLPLSPLRLRYRFPLWNPRNVERKMATKDLREDKYVFKLLMNNDTSRYYIEHHKGKSSHVAHGLVALDRLGATPARLDQFLSFYPDRLEKPDGEAAQDQQSDETDPEKLLGQRKGYYTLLQHYKDLFETKYGADLDQLVRGELPKLHKGVIGSAAHGIIQAGYGYAAKCNQVVCEGLAYIHHSYSPFIVSEEALYLGRGDTDITIVLENIRNDEELQEFMKSDEVNNLFPGRPFSSKTTSLFTKRGDTLAKYVSQIKVPEFDASKCTVEDVRRLCRWALDCSILVYSKSAYKNDFFLLHGVTALWSLLQLLDAIEDPQVALQAVQSAVFVLLAVYLIRGSPALTVKIDPTSLQYKEWSDIVKAVLEREIEDLEVHIPKLVQVVHDMSKDTSDSEKMVLYKAAANIVLTNNYYGR